ncbi:MULTISPECIES: hypothetical protein [Tsukamurella]|uniref:Uncharacterized protein n=2 Tax=Tsukamurella TaxID=2060 RepID=A0A5C5S221_9ACTN|nr:MULTISPECIES: hypothetical protein [Tsukamurella]NMD54135.1 hypothetical protein [Tsukamurella columbiensis]TWS28331.1 hypothetical protein FK530_14790 [Tsukamurella conjunctivitidis]
MMVYRVIAVLVYVVARLLLAACGRIGRVFHVGAAPIVGVITVASVAGIAAVHLIVLRERGMQPIVLLLIALPVLAAGVGLLMRSRRLHDPERDAHRYDGWIDN